MYVIYHHTTLMSDRRRWVEAIRTMHALFISKERGFWEARIEAAAGDSKKCWQTLNKLLCKDTKCKIPDSATAEVFSKFFVQKVYAVRAVTSTADVFTPFPKPCSFETFKPTSPEQVLFLQPYS